MARLVELLAALCAIACSVEAGRQMRIVGGKQYDIRVAPFMVQLKYWVDGKEGQAYKTHIICGGVIADAFHIVTAAHCFKDTKDPAKEVAVEVGATMRLSGGRTLAIKSVASHPKWKAGGFLNVITPYNQKFDIAVITLQEPLELDEYAQPIDIATKRVSENTTLFTGGWGANVEYPTGTPADFGPQLNIATVKTPTDAWCHKFFHYPLLSNIHKEAKDSLICTWPINGTPCGGDSGSALWIPQTESTKPVLVGVLTGAETCVTKKAMPAFVDVADPAIQEFLRANGLDL